MALRGKLFVHRLGEPQARQVDLQEIGLGERDTHVLHECSMKKPGAKSPLRIGAPC